MLKPLDKENAVIILIVSMLLLSACASNSRQTATPSERAASRTAAQTDSPGKKDYDAKIKVKTPDDKDVVEVKLDAGSTKLEYSGKVVRAETAGDKRKYKLETNAQIAEVKFKDADGFKVRDNDGKLLWKVKIVGDKIKISDNEENQNAFEIKKSADAAKIERGETKLGEVKFYSDRRKIKIKDHAETELFDADANSFSSAYAVLALSEIAEDLRFIIFAELLSRDNGWQ